MEFRRPYENSGVIVPENTADYVIYQEDGVVYAKNGKTGEVEFKGTDTADIMNSIITANPNGVYIHIKAGTYNGSTYVDVPSNTTISGDSMTSTILQFGLRPYNVGWRIENLEIYNPSNGTALIFDQWSNRGVVNNVFIYDATTAVDISADTWGFNFFYNLWIDSSDSTVQRTAFTLSGTPYHYNNVFVGLKIRNIYDAGKMRQFSSLFGHLLVEHGTNPLVIVGGDNVISNFYTEVMTNGGLTIGSGHSVMLSPRIGSNSKITIDNPIAGTQWAKYIKITLPDIDSTSSLVINGDQNYIEAMYDDAQRVIDNGTGNTIKVIFGGQNSSTVTFTGDGSTTTFSVAHGLVAQPSKYFMQALNDLAKNYSTFSADATYLYVNFSSAPPSGSTLSYYWYAEV